MRSLRGLVIRGVAEWDCANVGGLRSRICVFCLGGEMVALVGGDVMFKTSWTS
jgi:hypothetical protein